MCRLLAYASPVATTPAQLLGDDYTEAFQALARLHKDGWGSAWVSDGGRIDLQRVTASGHGDDELRRALSDIASSARIAHLRLASDGPAAGPELTHPFVFGDVTFAHNGTIEPKADLRDLLDERSRGELTADLDSIMYFALVRQHARALGIDVTDLAGEDAPSLAPAVLAALRDLRRVTGASSLNALILTPRELIAVNASARTPSPVAWFESVGIARDTLPPHHVDCYYDLKYRGLDDGSIVFSSTGVEDDRWSSVPEETVTTVRLGTLARETRFIDETLDARPADPATTADAGLARARRADTTQKPGEPVVSAP